jgi:squalene cyclase
LITVIGFSVVALLASHSYADPIDEKYQKAVDKGLEWLKKQQHKDGSWSNGGQNPVAMTAMGGLAMLCEGSTVTQGKYRDNIRLAVDWLMKKSNKGGARHGLVGNPDLAGETGRYMYGHGFAMLFLASAYGEEDDKQRRAELREILTRAVTYCGSAQSTDGGWYYTAKGDPPGNDNDEGSVTVTQMQALRACRDAGIPVPKEIMKKGADYLRKSTDNQGGVIYRLIRGGGMPNGGGKPALTAAAITCLFSAGDYNDEYVKKWFKFCYNEDVPPQQQRIPITGGGGGRVAFEEYTHFYYAASIYFLGEDGWSKMMHPEADPKVANPKYLTWSKYRNNYFEYILRTQGADGGWTGASGWGSGPIYTTSVHCVIMQLDKNCLPVFQR